MLVVHFKLFRSKRQVEDVDRILEEARRVEEEERNVQARDGIALTNQLLNLSRFMLMLTKQNKFVDETLKAARLTLDNQTKIEVKGESLDHMDESDEEEEDEDMLVESPDEDQDALVEVCDDDELAQYGEDHDEELKQDYE